MTHPTVDIILISWNGIDDTARALESVVPQMGEARTIAAAVNITVIDNGSSDGTAEMIVRRFPHARVIRLLENSGFTGGIAKGVEISDADFVIFLNNDAIAEAGWLKSLVQSLVAAPPDVVAVSGKIVDSTGTRNDFSGGILTFDGHAFQSDFRRPLESVDDPDNGAEILFACGGNMIVRREGFISLGGFDNDYFAYLEDVDFGWRAWLAGMRILYDRNATVRHRSSATSDRLGAFERGVLFERNALQTAIKNYEEELWQTMSGPLFLTYLHRIHTYAVTRNRGASALARPSFGEPAGRPVKKRFRDRIVEGLFRREAAVIDDPLSIMQFRALEWVFENFEHLGAKRQQVQDLRKRSDREILAKFPLHVVATYPGDAKLMASRLFASLAPATSWKFKTLEEIMES